MPKKKIYAVKKGKVTGILQSWEECKDSVDGYSGAEYKSFFTEKEANEYLYGTECPYDRKQVEADLAGADMAAVHREKCLPGQVIAYVDGSFDKSVGRYSFGCVMLTPEGGIVRESGNGDNPESVALRNVTGEMLGAMYAVKWCEKNDYPAIELCYDYMGIEKWVTGEWKAKNSLTQKYAQFMRNSSKKIKMTFRKIAAHTGNLYNEEADKLAKAALTEGNGIPKIKGKD
ncbi:MAG: ribonuclease H family protein [Roseburia sp.]|nr:ribonuclease H family protein [Roseburia sp.]